MPERDDLEYKILKNRKDFLSANRGVRAHGSSFVLLVHPRGDTNTAAGIGYTITKKVGNAVVRNRIKRRFRELARNILPKSGISGADHILIGKRAAMTQDFATLSQDLLTALARAARQIEKSAKPKSSENA
jgi:ribonuclease P protein component